MDFLLGQENENMGPEKGPFFRALQLPDSLQVPTCCSPDLKRKDRFEFSPDETIAMILRRTF